MDVETKIIMLETKPVFPKWVKEESKHSFKKLRTKIRKLHEVCKQINQFKKLQNPFETFFREDLKTARDTAIRLNSDLVKAGEEVDEAIGDCGVFGPELVKSIIEFREKTRKNEDATERVA